MPSRKFSTSSAHHNGAAHHNSVAVNPRMLKPLRGQWVKNGGKGTDSSSSREHNAKSRPPLGKLTKQKSFSEKENSLKHSESSNALLEREKAFIIDCSSRVASKPSALKINREKSYSDTDRYSSSDRKKPIVRPLSDSPIVRPLVIQTQVRSRLLLDKAKLDIDGKPVTHKLREPLPCVTAVVANSKRPLQNDMKTIYQRKPYSSVKSAEMQRLRSRQKQDQLSCAAQIQSNSRLTVLSSSASELSESDEDSR